MLHSSKNHSIFLNLFKKQQNIILFLVVPTVFILLFHVCRLSRSPSRLSPRGTLTIASGPRRRDRTRYRSDPGQVIAVYYFNTLSGPYHPQSAGNVPLRAGHPPLRGARSYGN